MNEGLSINSILNTSQDIVVTFTPNSDVLNYSYLIKKDDKYLDKVTINSNNKTDITFNETGVYQIQITTKDNKGNIKNINSGEYIIDKEKPVINIVNKTLQIKQNENVDLLSNVSALDNMDGDITSSVTTNINDIDLSKIGIKNITYSVKDKAGNESSEVVYLTVKENNDYIIKIGQLGIFITVLAIIIFIFKYIRSIKLEKRFSKFSITTSKNKSISLFDNLNIIYKKLVLKTQDIINRSDVIKNNSKRYEKYAIAFDEVNSGIEFISKKIILGVLYVILIFIIELVNSNMPQFYEFFIAFILGYFTLDIIYKYKYSLYRKKIENDLLESITIMNNAFKAGMSISQSVLLVSKELNGPISKEFKQISDEISLGLDIEIAFRRFANRIKLEDAVYLTTSLSVLNKTGGNIIKVFDSIEKSLFGRRKLQLELKSLTSSSRFITYILIVLPLCFIAFIGIINIEYFLPLITNTIGIILIIIMLLIYISYIIVVMRAMKVRM